MPDTDSLPATYPNQHVPAQTRVQQSLFLKALAVSGTVKAACARVNIPSVKCVYEWASASKVFSKRFDEAREKGEKRLLLRYEEHLDETLLPELAMPIEDFSRTQISRMFRMKRLDPRYRDNAPAVNVNVGPVAIQFVMQAEARDETPTQAPISKLPK